MTRTVFAAALALCGVTSAAQAQLYTSWYSPYANYYHAPAYSSYSYSSNYGPLGLVNWGAWRPSYTSYYASPLYASTAYTAAYAPLVTTASLGSACCPTSCCPTSCCDPCLACASCPSGGCPGGNCGLNYGPVDMKPVADPNASGTSGTRTYESESNGRGTDDGFGPAGGTERGAGYRPQEKIDQRAPTKGPEESEAPEARDEAEPGLNAPSNEPAAEALLNLDTKLTQGPSLLRERLPMKARFGSPKLARAKVDPSKLPGAADLRLVRK